MQERVFNSHYNKNKNLAIRNLNTSLKFQNICKLDGHH